jgi:hypothetical protein
MGFPVGGGVTVGRVVATADVTVAHAEAQVDPAATDPQAVLAAGRGRRNVLDGVEVGAGVSHARLPYCWGVGS